MNKSAYKTIEVMGSSRRSWENASRAAVKRAKAKFADLNLIRSAHPDSLPQPNFTAEVVAFDLDLDAGEVRRFRVRLRVTFTVDESHL